MKTFSLSVGLVNVSAMESLPQSFHLQQTSGNRLTQSPPTRGCGNFRESGSSRFEAVSTAFEIDDRKKLYARNHIAVLAYPIQPVDRFVVLPPVHGTDPKGQQRADNGPAPMDPDECAFTK
jgi:hypothetical protein